MFFREFKYTLLTLLRSKELIFWTLVFPFALCTFMYMAFGNLFETTEKFDPIPTAIVQKGDNPAFAVMLGEISAKGDDQLLIANYTGEEQAEKISTALQQIDKNTKVKIKYFYDGHERIFEGKIKVDVYEQTIEFGGKKYNLDCILDIEITEKY